MTTQSIEGAMPPLPDLRQFHNSVDGVIELVMKRYGQACAEAAAAPLLARVAELEKDAARWRVLVDSCGETPLRPEAFGSELAPDTRLKIDFPTIVSFDSVGNVTTLNDWADAALAAHKEQPCAISQRLNT
jgi:hypothetical protein